MDNIRPRFLLVVLLFFFFNESFCTQKDTLKKLSNSVEKKFPPCHYDLLDHNSYLQQPAKETKRSKKVFFNMPHWDFCQLLQLRTKRVVTCLDALYQDHVSRNPNNLLDQTNAATTALNFVFIGDSRIRQQFFNFLRLIPDYDRETQPDPMPFFVHEDMQFTSKILELRVAFFWRPLINANATETIRQWTMSYSNVTNWIVINMEIHHMLQENGADYKLYQKQLMKLVPILDQLAIFNHVIWLNQYPTIDPHHLEIFSEKIFRYNQGIRSLFRNWTAIQIWDTSNQLAEEYIRSCAIYSQRESKGEYTAQYVACKDHVHTGNAALFQATQLLFNHICQTVF